jgi:suppressor of ftsI
MSVKISTAQSAARAWAGPTAVATDIPDPERISTFADHDHFESAPAAGGPAPAPVRPTREVRLVPGANPPFELSMVPVTRDINGVQRPGIAYDGSIPGPIFRVKQNDHVQLTLRNGTDRPTTLHPHGLRLDDYKSDGVPHVGQDPIPPGGTFTHNLNFPDPGLYWYHPHIQDWGVRELGAYGMFLVEPEDPNYYSPVNREEILALDDILLQNGDIDLNDPTHVFWGMWGDTMLVNGQPSMLPDGQPRPLLKDVKKGEVIRFHALNAADARPFNLRLRHKESGEWVDLKAVASDLGKHQREMKTAGVLLAPAERQTFEVLVNKAGEYELVNDKDTGTDAVLGTFSVGAEEVAQSYATQFHTLRTNADVVADIQRFEPYFDRAPDKRLVLSPGVPTQLPVPARTPWSQLPEGDPLWSRRSYTQFDARNDPNSRPEGPGGVVWKIFDPDTLVTDPVTGQQRPATNDEIRWSFKQTFRDGAPPTKIEVLSQGGQHPLHFHGQRFLVLSVNGKKNPDLQWKDTFLMHLGDSKAEILLDNSHPGVWMFHCHIGRHALDLNHGGHHEHRMTGHFNVEPVPGGHNPHPHGGHGGHADHAMGP